MPLPENTNPKPALPAVERCRLIFEGRTDSRLPREVPLERLRRLLKDDPEIFERRMARMPLVLLPDCDSATARGYQRLLAQKGILCRIVQPAVGRPEDPLPPPTMGGETPESALRDEDRLAPPEIPSDRTPLRPTRFQRGLLSVFNLGVALCFNPRGLIGRVESAAPYRVTLILAAAVGLVQAGGAVLAEHPAGTPAILLSVLALLIVAPALGILFVYVRGFLLHAAGRLLKGRASPRELRVALAWSEIPLLLGGLIPLLQVAMGRLGGAVPFQAADPGLPGLLSQAGFGILQASLGFWALSLLLYTIAEIQGFSLSRSFANIVLAAAVVLGPLAVIGGVLIRSGLVPFG